MSFTYTRIPLIMNIHYILSYYISNRYIYNIITKSSIHFILPTFTKRYIYLRDVRVCYMYPS